MFVSHPGFGPRPSGRTASDFNHRGVSPAPPVFKDLLLCVEYIGSMCVCVPYACSVHKGQEESDPLGLELESCESVDAGTRTLGSLEEQLLTLSCLSCGLNF